MRILKIFYTIITISFITGSCTRKPVQTATVKPSIAISKPCVEKIKIVPDTTQKTTVATSKDSLLQHFLEPIATPNYNMRKPNFVIIHHTAQNTCAQTFRTFSLARTQVSAHYVICRDGSVTQLLSDYLRAWHAGISRWGNTTDLNSCSIGIELDNNGVEPFDSVQINSLLVLLDTLKKNHSIPTANFIGHGDIAPIRKNDPSILFPWKKLAEKGFGLWYDENPGAVDSNFNQLQALRIIGYSLKDTTATIAAFKRHFTQDSSSTLTDWDKRVLNNLYKKYMY